MNLISIKSIQGQNPVNNRTYNHIQLEKNKIFDETFRSSWYKNSWRPNASDTKPYFVDDRGYKGFINYGVTFKRKDHRNLTVTESKTICFLKLETTSCTYNPKDSVFVIQGFIAASVDTSRKKGAIKEQVDVFLGVKTDTIDNCYFGSVFSPIFKVNRDTVDVKINNIDADAFTVLDRFPAFYLKKYAYNQVDLEPKSTFTISGKVTPNSLLVLSTRHHYAEIFDVGSMIFNPNKNENEIDTKKEVRQCKQLIIQSKLVADLEKEKKEKKEINYYTYTQKAEDYILARQYGSAKQQYTLLSQKYATLFARDIHNAIRCAILSRDIKASFWWGEKMAYKGVALSYFNSKIFAGMRKNVEWKIFSVKYDSICTKAKNNWNLKLKNEINNLVEEDQADYGLENRKPSKVLFETTERITGKWIDLLNKEGFPSEEKIGVNLVNDTVLIFAQRYYVLFRHSIQQKPKNAEALSQLLTKSSNNLEFDGKRSGINVMPTNSCLHIYKGNLYNLKSCGTNDLMIRKIIFMFNNQNRFFIDRGNYIVSEFNKENSKEWDDYYEHNFNFIIKLTDDWEFYEK